MLTSPLNPIIPFPGFDGRGLSRSNVTTYKDQLLPRHAVETDVSPQKIVDLRVVDSLEKTLNSEGMSLKGLNYEDFAPQNVADRILGSVRQAYGRFRQSHPEAGDGEFFSRVREGVEKGFAEAKEILQNLGVLQGQVAADVDQTYNLTRQGLDQLEFGGSVSSIGFEGITMQSSHSTQIQIETREGDKISIGFSQAATAGHSTLVMTQPDGALSAYRQSASYGSELNISIEGDLNPGEQKALRRLMQDMYQVGHAFFQGNNKVAMHHAMKLGFDSEQLAGFSMDLNVRKSVQAVAAYRQSSLPEQQVSSDLLGQAGDFLADVKAMLADAPSKLQALADPRQAFGDLFAAIGMLSIQNPAPVKGGADRQGFAALVDMLGRNLFPGGIDSQVR